MDSAPASPTTPAELKREKPRLLKVQLTHPLSKLPTKAYQNDVGWDLYAVEDTVLEAGTFTNVNFGLRFQFPPGYWGFLTGRSSTTYSRKFIVIGSVIDPDYTGPMFCMCFNPGKKHIVVKAGERIAQLVPFWSAQALDLNIFEVSELDDVPSDTSIYRGNRGFGSSGK